MAAFRAGGDHGATIELVVESRSRFPTKLVAAVGHICNAPAGDAGRVLATMVQQSNVRPE